MVLVNINQRTTWNRAGDSQGVALVLVLWIIVLLSVIGISHSRNVRLDMQMARHYVEGAKAKAMAESGLSRAIYELFNQHEETQWAFDGELYTVEIPEGQIQIKVRNTAGLIDINTASDDTLDTLLSGIELEREQRESIIDSILDWKDPDDLKRLNGAEDGDYRAKGMEYGTPDREFFSIGELRYVMGMNTAIYNAISPYITIYSKQEGINPEYAPDELKMLFGHEEGIPLESDFSSLFKDNRDEIGILPSDMQGGVSNVYHVSVWSTTTNGASAGLEVDVDMTATMKSKYTILSWQESSQ